MSTRTIVCACHGHEVAIIGELGSLTCLVCGEQEFPRGTDDDSLRGLVAIFQKHFDRCGRALHHSPPQRKEPTS